MKLWFAGACGVCVVATAIACSDSEDSSTPSPDAGPLADTPATDAGPTLTLLTADGFLIIGVTPAGLVVYYSGEGIEAIPVTGGTPIKILTAPQTGEKVDGVAMAGGAVAWWTNATDGIGTLNAWNATDGVKTGLSTTSVVGNLFQENVIFAATPDGRRIAFSTSATVDVTNLQVVEVANATPVTTGLFPDTDLIDRAKLAEPGTPCKMHMGFAGQKLITTFCSVVDGRRAFFVPENATAAIRFDDKGPGAGPIGTQWSADDVGNHVYVNGDSIVDGRYVDLTNTAAIRSVNLKGAVEGFVTKDGISVVHRAGSEIFRTTPATDPGGGGLVVEDAGVKKLAAKQTEIAYWTTDQARLLTTEGQAGFRTIDTTTPNQTPTVITSVLVYPSGFTGTGSHVVFTKGDLATSTTVFSVPSTGGAEKELATLPGTLPRLAPEGNGAVFGVNEVPDPATLGGSVFELRHVDVVTGTTHKVSDGASSFLAFAGRRVVFIRVNDPGKGLYAFDPNPN